MRLTTSPRQTGDGGLPGQRISRHMAIAGVAAGLLLTFVLDRGTGSAPFQHLYYLPIIFAAFTLNWGGGLAASLCAIVLYHLANPALLVFGYREPDFVQMTLFVAVGVVTSTLPGRSEADALGIAEELCRAVNESAPTLAGKRFSAGTLSISLGVAHRRWTVEFPDPRTDERAGESLFRAADAALYAAKSRGRNQVFVASGAPGPASHRIAAGVDRPA